jgi:hypothetical protein
MLTTRKCGTCGALLLEGAPAGSVPNACSNLGWMLQRETAQIRITSLAFLCFGRDNED